MEGDECSIIEGPISRELRVVVDILANVKDCIIVRKPNHEICYWNKGAAHLLGYGESEVMGKIFLSRLIGHNLKIF